MKNLFLLIPFVIACFILQWLGPWWLPALAALVLGFVKKDQSATWCFALGFIGLFILWFGWSFYSNSVNGGILSSRIGELFNGLSGIILVVVTGLIGGMLGGLGAMTGNLASKAFTS